MKRYINFTCQANLPHYNVIAYWERIFLEDRGSVINYCLRQIIMNNEVVINFDEKSCVDKLHRVN
jgi:hypothetical protein